ncbi:Z1 domain-containing protein [Luteimonas sp. SMYT11W]|uniref:Z1 domain-containing protein n=1 Tax=Luteimonas flava TaxID=3115822 RepID=A0ABU7WG83_9GAMM
MPHEQLLGLARTAMAQQAAQTPEQIEDRVRELAALPFLSPPPTQNDIRESAQQIEREFKVVLGSSHTIQATGHRPWLRARKHEIEFRYWDRYRRYLIAEGLGEPVVNKVSEITDTIVDLAGDPKIEGAWSRRGLVVGHVQSGKTANYLGVINKAADAGYRVVILIAGVHNNLRSQTQERVDFGFVGRDSDQLLSKQANAAKVGVGGLAPGFTATAYTSRATDFSRPRAEGLGIPIQNSREPVILVIKKNPAILRNLIDWIRGTSAESGGLTLPMLVIDDEADNASVNTSKDPEAPRTINRLIRELLNLSARNAYIGYTATPFANIFIDPDQETDGQGKDLFPRDFIVGLDAPSNYVGAHDYFLSDDADWLTVDLEGTEDWLPTTHKITWTVEGLHETLIEAVDCFVLSKAIRILRGQGAKHHSMLVNVSRFTCVQGDVAREIDQHLTGMKAAIQNRYALPVEVALRDPSMHSLHTTWQKHYAHADEEWDAIQSELHRAAASMSVVQVNASKQSGKLDYRAHAETGLNVIAVGGNSLSRGFTLEGLTVSYLLRNTQMYDTLLQMGRWFGYRDGFRDLCRLFLREDASDWYGFIAGATDELRDEIRRMELNGLTPMDFGFAVRSHPGTLMITAKDKMRTAKEMVRQVGLANSMVETSVLLSAEPSRTGNVAALERVVKVAQSLGPSEATGEERVLPTQIFRSIPTEHVLDFIASFGVHPGLLEMQASPLSDYIRKRGFAEWDIALYSSSRATGDDVLDVHGIAVGAQKRFVHDRKNALLVSGTKRRVASRAAERVGLTPLQVGEAIKAHGSDTNVPDKAYRAQRSRPLLMLHLLRVNHRDPDTKAETPGAIHAAYGLSFPDLPSGQKEELVTYAANLVAYRELFGNSVDEDDDEEAPADA